MNKKRVYLGLLLLLVILSIPPVSLPAQEEGEKEAKAEDPLGLGTLFDSGFELLECEELVKEPSGKVLIKGRIDLRTTDLKLKCNSLTVDPETKILVALGTPVKVNMGGTEAECRKFTHNLKTNHSKLEQNPIIFEKNGDRITKISGDEITLFKNDKGETGMHIKPNKKNPGGLTRFEVIDNKEKEDEAKPKDKEPKKIKGKGNLSLLRLPATD